MDKKAYYYLDKKLLRHGEYTAEILKAQGYATDKGNKKNKTYTEEDKMLIR